MMRPALSLLAVLFVRDAAALVVTVTHAAGRMGVSVVGQLRESGQLSGEEEELGIRAVVRNEREASRLKLDLCGAVLRNGELRPLLDLKDDLGIDLFVVEDDAHEQEGLAAAFEGADVAVLLSAAHADFSPDVGGEGGPKSSESLLPTSLLPKSMSATATGVNVRVPPLPGAAAARRLGAEVCAWPVQCAFRVHVMRMPCVFAHGRGAQLPSGQGPDPDPDPDPPNPTPTSTQISAVANAPGMGHVLLRSSMGVGALRCASHKEASDYTQQLASAAVTRMGGGATIAAQADADSP